ELILERAFAGGEARPAEEFDLVDTTRNFRLEAVVRPRRARVVLNLVRGDTVSAPRGVDLIPDEPPRVVQLVLAGRPTTLVVGLTRPQPARTERERALALDVDVICLRVAPPDTPEPIGQVCGRLNNVARQLPLPTGDTLAATFAWPGPRAGGQQQAAGGGSSETQGSDVFSRAARPLAGPDRRWLRGAYRRRDRRVDRCAGVLVGFGRGGDRPACADRGLRRRHGRRVA